MSEDEDTNQIPIVSFASTDSVQTVLNPEKSENELILNEVEQ